MLILAPRKRQRISQIMSIISANALFFFSGKQMKPKNAAIKAGTELCQLRFFFIQMHDIWRDQMNEHDRFTQVHLRTASLHLPSD